MVFCWHVTDFYILKWPHLLMVTSRTLKAKQRTGRGQLIDVSLLRSGLWCNGMMLAAAASAPNNPAAVVRATIHFFLRFRKWLCCIQCIVPPTKKEKKKKEKEHVFVALLRCRTTSTARCFFPSLSNRSLFIFFIFPFSHFSHFLNISVTLSDGHCLLHHHWLHLYKEYMRDPRRLGPTFRVRARNDNDLW